MKRLLSLAIPEMSPDIKQLSKCIWFQGNMTYVINFDGLVQDCSNSIAIDFILLLLWSVMSRWTEMGMAEMDFIDHLALPYRPWCMMKQK